MAEVTARTRVQVRDSFGRFIAECERAKVRTAEVMGRHGYAVSVSRAPRRTGVLADTMWLNIDNGVAQWGSRLPYAQAQDKGGRPHLISGNPWLSFAWDKSPTGRFKGPDVNHPGNPAVHFLRDGQSAAMSIAMAVARREYPH